ncbi:MAG: helix-turn-helix domain-containing protein [Clostridiales bacterium]|jgi:DNA-binding transcriptional regulator YhcF (GntR family)|nr:helix-turn-helix domain-containing protein [Clostridiales bacterium]
MKPNTFYTYSIVFDAPISGNAKLVYAYLCKMIDREGKCFPSHKTIGAAAGMCVTTVKKALAELESAGLIAIRGEARPDRGRRANTYTIMKERVNTYFLTYDAVFGGCLTAKARLVYLYFCRLASGRDVAYPSHRTTAKACGLSVAGARLAIDELEADGLVTRQAQFRENGGQRANLYTLVSKNEQSDEISAGIISSKGVSETESCVTVTPSHITPMPQCDCRIIDTPCITAYVKNAADSTRCPSRLIAAAIAVARPPPMPPNARRNLIYNNI